MAARAHTPESFTRAVAAAGRGDAEALAKLLDEPEFDVNMEHGGTTLLIETLAKGHTDLSDLLLRRGADINQGCSHVVTPLCAAAAANQMRSVRWLLDNGCDVTKLADDRPFYTVTTPLHFAILHKNLQMAKLLISSGHDTNFPSNNHNYPIIEVMRQNSLGIAQLLVSDPACDVNTCGRLFGGYDSVPPLHQCIFTFRRYEITQILLASQRCSLTHRGRSFLSVMLHKALDPTLSRKLKFYQMMLEAGADVIQLDTRGRSAFTTLIDSNDTIFVISLLQTLMELLVRVGLKPTPKEAESLLPYVKTEEERTFYNWLRESAMQPYSLQETCRGFLRRYFGAYPNGRLRKLPLPEPLLCFVTLECLRDFP